MKMTERQLRKIIREEIERSEMLDEGWLDDLKSRFGGGKKDAELSSSQDRPSHPSSGGSKDKRVIVAGYLKQLKTAPTVQAALEIIGNIGKIDPKLEEPLIKIADNLKKGFDAVVTDAADTIRGVANVKEGVSRERNRNLSKSRQKRL
jgi:hypothetical protein